MAEENQTQPFNSGLATLSRIDEILRGIHAIRIVEKTKWDVKYTFVYRAVEDLLNVSAPLLGKEAYDELTTRLYLIPLRPKYNAKGLAIEDREHQIEINRIISDCQFKLQELGFLMPDKKTNHFSKVA